MKFDIITIFPSIFSGFLSESLLSKAQLRRSDLPKPEFRPKTSGNKPILSIKIHNLREWTTDRHQTVDGKSYGGGPGLVFKVEPIYRAVSSIKYLVSKSNKKNQNKSYSIFKHVMIGVITTILLLTVVKAVSTAWHAAEEIRMTIDGVETNLQNAAETGQLAKLRTFGEKKTLQKAWDDGDFITDFPDGMVTTRTGSGYYKCEAERCIATCLGNKIFLKLNEGKYCGRQTWSDWSDYNDNDGYDKIRIKVLFGVNGWNVNNCQFCSVGSDSYSMGVDQSGQEYGWSYCVPELGGCAPYTYFGDWDRVSRPMQKEVNFKCESINAIGQSDCNPQQRPLANGIRMYTPALDPGLTVADWSASEFSYPTIEPT